MKKMTLRELKRALRKRQPHARASGDRMGFLLADIVARIRGFPGALEDALHRVLERGEPVSEVVEENPGWQAPLEEEVETARWIHDARPHFDPRPGFVGATRGNLLSKIKDEPQQKGWQMKGREAPHWHFPRLVIVLCALGAMLLAGKSLVMAADSAIPGEFLYPVKSGAENVRLALTRDPTRAAELRLRFAQDHLVAYAVLVSQGRDDLALKALRNYDRHMVGITQAIRSMTDQSRPDAIRLTYQFNSVFLQDVQILDALRVDSVIQ